MDLIRQIGRFIFGRVLPRGLTLPVLRGPLRGMKMILGSAAGEGKGATVYFNLMEPEQTAAVARLLQPGQVFYDIGANIGYYCLLAARRVGHEGSVFAVEPVLRNVAFLKRHLSINKLENVRILPVACADVIAIAGFAFGDNPAEGHFLDGEAEGARPGLGRDTIFVPVFTIDSIVRGTQAKPDAIKIDVEGAELDVLKGAQNTLTQQRPLIFLSVHSPELRKQCTLLLQEWGYDVGRLTSLDNDNELLAKPLEK